MRFLPIILMVLLLCSCQDVQRAKKPDDLIPERKMVDVLTELSLVQGARSYNRQMLEQAGLKPREYIWRKFDIDSSQFSRSSDYYARNYVQYQRIYDSVKVRLEGLKEIYDSIRVEEERVRDSILAEERVRDSILAASEADTIEDPLKKKMLDSLRQDRPARIRPHRLPERIPRDSIPGPF